MVKLTREEVEVFSNALESMGFDYKAFHRQDILFFCAFGTVVVYFLAQFVLMWDFAPTSFEYMTTTETTSVFAQMIEGRRVFHVLLLVAYLITFFLGFGFQTVSVMMLVYMANATFDFWVLHTLLFDTNPLDTFFSRQVLQVSVLISLLITSLRYKA